MYWLIEIIKFCVYYLICQSLSTQNWILTFMSSRIIFFYFDHCLYRLTIYFHSKIYFICRIYKILNISISLNYSKSIFCNLQIWRRCRLQDELLGECVIPMSESATYRGGNVNRRFGLTARGSKNVKKEGYIWLKILHSNEMDRV